MPTMQPPIHTTNTSTIQTYPTHLLYLPGALIAHVEPGRRVLQLFGQAEAQGGLGHQNGRALRLCCCKLFGQLWLGKGRACLGEKDWDEKQAMLSTDSAEQGNQHAGNHNHGRAGRPTVQCSTPSPRPTCWMCSQT